MITQAILLGPPAKLELNHRALEHGVTSLRTGVPDAGHRPILDAIAGLLPGEAIRITIDHDPMPLRRIVERDHPGMYAWESLLEGPDRWVGLLRRRQPKGVVRLPPRLDRRATLTGARRRLERELEAVAIDLVGPAERDELSQESAAWLGAATDAAVHAVGDSALSVLVHALDGLLEAAPPAVTADLEAARNRRDLGVM